jgi:Putative adhesin
MKQTIQSSLSGRLLLLWALLLPIVVSSQTTLQVVSKNFAKTIDWKKGVELIINCEKAEVIIEPSDSLSINVKAELSARHPSLDTATTDVETWQFVTTVIGKKIYIRAYLGLVGGKKAPVSNMKAKIVVHAPKSCAVELNNKFGKAFISQLDGGLVLNGSFCTFQLTDLGGKVKVESQYGDIDAKNLKGTLEVQSKRANVHLNTVAGDCTVTSEYGKIEVETSPEMANLKVNGNKSEVVLHNTENIPHNISLATEYGQITAPANFDKQTSTDNTQRAIRTALQQFSKVEIITSFANIILDQP